jgi:hypothetical protein
MVLTGFILSFCADDVSTEVLQLFVVVFDDYKLL